MIKDNGKTVVLGFGTIVGTRKKSEPNALYILDIPKGRYKTGDTIPQGEKVEVNSYLEMKFSDFATPLRIVRELKQAQTLGTNMVKIGEVTFDFTGDETGEAHRVVQEYFLNTVKSMVLASGLDKNDFSRMYDEYVGA